MAPGKELNEFLDSSQAAALRSNDYSPRELCDNLLNSITTNIKICKYTDPTASSLKFDDNRSLILLHVNIRSLHKIFDSLYEFLVTLSFSPDITCLTLTETRLKGKALIRRQTTEALRVDYPPPRPVIPVFDGDPLIYKAFATSFQAHITNRVASANARLTYLV